MARTDLRHVYAQKGLAGSVALNGPLARVSVDLKSGATPGSVTLAVDWEALGMTPDKVAISLPDVGSVRKPQATIT